mmetsp:Transcript_9189/g.13363  ORF Transcript_9189/g.13363 Transcript_9189/m.13363 type:complete len:110 (+) Transcript_9189:172-501(+)
MTPSLRMFSLSASASAVDTTFFIARHLRSISSAHGTPTQAPTQEIGLFSNTNTQNDPHKIGNGIFSKHRRDQTSQYTDIKRDNDIIYMNNGLSIQFVERTTNLFSSHSR